MKGMDIRRAVELKYGVDMSQRNRKPGISLARQIGMYLTRKRTSLSYMQTARLFGRKDHTTAIYAEAKIGRMCLDEEFKREIDSIL